MSDTKGYYTSTTYKGNIDGEYRDFPTDDEYVEYKRELEEEEENGD